MVVAKVCERVAPATVSPLSKSMCCAPSTGFTPTAGPFTKETVPEPPRTQPVMLVDPLGRACPPSDTTGDSKLPLVKGPMGGEGETGITEMLSANRSTAMVADEVSVSVSVEFVVVAVNVKVCDGPYPSEPGAIA